MSKVKLDMPFVVEAESRDTQPTEAELKKNITDQLAEELANGYNDGTLHNYNPRKGPILVVYDIKDIPSSLFEIMPHSAIEDIKRNIDLYGAAELSFPEAEDDIYEGNAYRLKSAPTEHRKQPHRHSMLEILVHTVTGFLVAVIMVALLAPTVPLISNLTLCLYITGVKLVINYIIRRIFTALGRD